MRITESRLRSIIRQVIKEQVLKEEWWDDEYAEEKGEARYDWRVSERLFDYWRDNIEAPNVYPAKVSFDVLKPYIEDVYSDAQTDDATIAATIKGGQNKDWLDVGTNEVGESVVIFKNPPSWAS